MVNRKERTLKIINTINKEWSQYYFKFILDNPIQNWNWYVLSKNPNITMEIIRDNPEKPWDWSEISWNKNITMEFQNIFLIICKWP